MQFDLNLFGEADTAAAYETSENNTSDSTDNTEEAVTDSRYDDFCKNVRSMKNAQRARLSGIARMCAARYGVDENDYDAIEKALDGDTSDKEKSIDDMLTRLEKESENITQLYPSFNLKDCLCDRKFFSLCYKGVDVKTAYEITHHDEIILAAMAYAVEQLRKSGIDGKTVYRPREGALNTVSGMKQEKQKLTRKDRTELIKRAERGEKITL